MKGMRHFQHMIHAQYVINIIADPETHYEQEWIGRLVLAPLIKMSL